jgi:hypothetical protein
MRRRRETNLYEESECKSPALTVGLVGGVADTVDLNAFGSRTVLVPPLPTAIPPVTVTVSVAAVATAGESRGAEAPLLHGIRSSAPGRIERCATSLWALRT